MTRFIIALTFIIFAGGAWAGEAAKLNILGFSEDGSIFAFEQYGVQDGSGFPYSERFYINTSDDSFVQGTPIKVRLDDEMAPEDVARAQAKAASPIDDASLSMRNAHIVASREITELGDRKQLRFIPRPIYPSIDTPFSMTLNEYLLPSSDICTQMQGQMAFEILISNLRKDRPVREFHKDATIPNSRGCPLGYGFARIITNYAEGKDPSIVAIIAVQSVGFEGPDHRYIAIAKPLLPFE